MTYADIQAVWLTATDAPPPVSPSRLADLRTEAARFDRKILWRDLRELAAAFLVAILFGRVLLSGSAAFVDRLGAGLAIAGAAFAIAWMWGTRLRAPRPSPALPTTEAVRVALARVDAQVRLLRTVAWWYLLPLAIGPFVMTFGVLIGTPLTPLAVALMAVVAALFVAFASVTYRWIYRLNQRAVRDELLPLRDRLAGLLADLTSSEPQ